MSYRDCSDSISLGEIAYLDNTATIDSIDIFRRFYVMFLGYATVGFKQIETYKKGDSPFDTLSKFKD